MGAATAISWTDATWTPVRARVKDDAAAIAEQKGYESLIQIAGEMAGRVGPHCEKASPGCQNCYSETNNARCLPHNGTGLPFDRRSRNLVDIFLDEKILLQPLRWKKGRRIFVCSQTDLFGEFVPDELIDRAFAVMALCPQHTFQVLTKRAERMERWATERTGSSRAIDVRIYKHVFRENGGPLGNAFPGWPLPNVWMGASCEDQRRADERIPHLLRTPAAVRFLSCEPLLEEIDLDSEEANGLHALGCDCAPKIDWVIAGAESGLGARPCSEDWIRSLRDQCQAAGTAFFYKQWAVGGRKVDTPELDGVRWVEFPQ